VDSAFESKPAMTDDTGQISTRITIGNIAICGATRLFSNIKV
jgi:hypothetical protein